MNCIFKLGFLIKNERILFFRIKKPYFLPINRSLRHKSFMVFKKKALVDRFYISKSYDL